MPDRLTEQIQAGQERFRTLSTSYYRGAQGVILVYDISSRASFNNMERWFDEAEMNTAPDTSLYLVGAKLDKAESGRTVSVAEGQALAEAHGALFCEASAKTRENVRKPFVEIVDAIVSDPAKLEGARTGKVQGAVNLASQAGSYASGCSC